MSSAAPLPETLSSALVQPLRTAPRVLVCQWLPKCSCGTVMGKGVRPAARGSRKRESLQRLEGFHLLPAGHTVLPPKNIVGAVHAKSGFPSG